MTGESRTSATFARCPVGPVVATAFAVTEPVEDRRSSALISSHSPCQTRTPDFAPAALSLPPYFVSMILPIFLLLFGPRMVQGGLEQLSSVRRQRWERALLEATRRTQVYVWASIAQAVVSGLAIWLVGTWLGVPAVALVALFGATIALLPYVGVAVGWLPVLLLGIGVGGASDVEVLLAAGLAALLQAAEWVYWRSLVDGRSLHVGPAVPVVVAIVGFGIHGIGGALYGCVLAVLALALADQLSPDADDIPTPLDDPDDELPNDASPDDASAEPAAPPAS